MVPWLVLAALILAPSGGFLLWSWRAQHKDIVLMRAHGDDARGRRRQAAAREPGRGQRQAPMRLAGDR